MKGRTLSALVLSVGILFAAACGDDEPTGFEVQDGHVLAVAVELNAAIVTMSEPAETQTATTAVLAFADGLITDHAASNVVLDDLTITPIATDLSASIELQAAAGVEALELLNDDAFDDEYVQNMIDLHEYALDVLVQVLIPDADDPELIAELEAMRATFEAGLEAAEQLQADLAAAA